MSNRNLPYNERAFSPLRMMNCSNQQNESIISLQQAIYRLQNNNIAKQQQQNQDFTDGGWCRNETDYGRDERRDNSDFRGNTGYDPSISQQTYYSNDYQSMSYDHDSMPSNSDLRFRLSDRQSDSNYGHSYRVDQRFDQRSDHVQPWSDYETSRDQRFDYESSRDLRSDYESSNYASSSLQRSDYASTSRSNVDSNSRSYISPWENGQGPFDDRMYNRDDRVRDNKYMDDRFREERHIDDRFRDDRSRNRDERAREERLRKDRLIEGRIREDRLIEQRRRQKRLREDQKDMQNERRRDHNSKSSSQKSSSSKPAPRNDTDSKPSSLIDSKPKPSSSSDSKPKPSSLSDSKPKTSSLSDSKPKTSSLIDSKPKPSSSSDSKPNSSSLSDSKPKPSSSTVSNPKSSHPSSSKSSSEHKQNNKKYPDIGESKLKPKFDEVFEIVRKYEDTGKCVYKCKICQIDYLPDHNVASHLVGKRHKSNLKEFEDTLPGKTKFQKVKQMKEILNDKLYSHEPMFEVVISDIKEPLIGLEYIVEILDVKCKEQEYRCVLCNKRCQPRIFEKHIVSITHRLNYLAKHFIPLYDKLQASRRFKDDNLFRKNTLTDICSRIEDKFGRSSAFVYEGSDYNDTKTEILDSIFQKKHATIDDIPDALNYLLDGIKLIHPEWERENPPLPPKEPLELEAGVKRKRKVPSEVLEDYKSAVEYTKSMMEKKLKDYERDPDSHPKYKEEWEQFWNKKIDEMAKRGEDSSNHNFHDEWCEFFIQRIRKLHEQDLNDRVDQIRRNLGLTKEETGEKSDDPEPKRDRRDRNTDNDDDYKLDRVASRRIPKDKLYVKEKKIFNKFLHEVGIDVSKRPKPQPILVEKKEPYDRSKLPEQITVRSKEPTTLITTCRLLTSLEQELGLLAQKVLDLLSKSIAYEREHSKSSDELLFDNENLILIETVKEKIIGMQMAHLITQSRAKAVEKAVYEIKKLIEQHEVMVNIKKTLKEMGKDEASPEEIEMLKVMFMKKKDDEKSKVKEKEATVSKTK